MLFFVGLHQPSDGAKFDRCMVSVNRLRKRRSDFPVRDWIMDSGAFTSVARDGGYSESPADYAAQVRRWSQCGRMLAAVSQDFMCEPWVLERTGHTVAEHQRMTIERYDAILDADPGAYLMPVLQGYRPHEYAEHIEQYGDRLGPNVWVGVGSVCKRNAAPDSVLAVLLAIRDVRSDLKLHGFGVKLSALERGEIRALLHSADSMAWSFHARKNGFSANCWTSAQRFIDKIADQRYQEPLFV